MGHLLALRVSPANEDEPKEVEKLSEQIQEATGENGRVGLRRSRIHGREGLRGGRQTRHIGLEVVKSEEAKRGLVLFLARRRWVVEGDFAWASRFWRLVKDY